MPQAFEMIWGVVDALDEGDLRYTRAASLYREQKLGSSKDLSATYNEFSVFD